MFTYRDYYDLVTEILSIRGNQMFLRHDVDISLKKALEMAEREHTMKLGPATYFIHTCSEWYNPLDDENSEIIRKILDLGHNIGLHYDANVLGTNERAVVKAVVLHANFLGFHFNTQVKSISQHMPRKHPVSLEFLTALKDVELFDPMLTMNNYKYVSDSGMMFLEDPIEACKYHDRLHLNIHPEWWAESEGNFEDRLHDLKLDTSLDQRIYKRVQGIREHNARAKDTYNRSPQGGNNEPPEAL